MKSINLRIGFLTLLVLFQSSIRLSIAGGVEEALSSGRPFIDLNHPPPEVNLIGEGSSLTQDSDLISFQSPDTWNHQLRSDQIRYPTEKEIDFKSAINVGPSRKRFKNVNYYDLQWYKDSLIPFSEEKEQILDKKFTPKIISFENARPVIQRSKSFKDVQYQALPPTQTAYSSLTISDPMVRVGKRKVGVGRQREARPSGKPGQRPRKADEDEVIYVDPISAWLGPDSVIYAKGIDSLEVEGSSGNPVTTQMTKPRRIRIGGKYKAPIARALGSIHFEDDRGEAVVKMPIQKINAGFESINNRIQRVEWKLMPENLARGLGLDGLVTKETRKKLHDVLVVRSEEALNDLRQTFPRFEDDFERLRTGLEKQWKERFKDSPFESSMKRTVDNCISRQRFVTGVTLDSLRLLNKYLPEQLFTNLAKAQAVVYEILSEIWSDPLLITFINSEGKLDLERWTGSNRSIIYYTLEDRSSPSSYAQLMSETNLNGVVLLVVLHNLLPLQARWNLNVKSARLKIPLAVQMMFLKEAKEESNESYLRAH